MGCGIGVAVLSADMRYYYIRTERVCHRPSFLKHTVQSTDRNIGSKFLVFRGATCTVQSFIVAFT
jgi:hypothetical protein